MVQLSSTWPINLLLDFIANRVGQPKRCSVHGVLLLSVCAYGLWCIWIDRPVL